MSEIRLIDANALKYKNLAEVNGKLTYVLTAEEINNAPTVELNDKSLEIARKSIELGRNVGKLEGKLERPQGEWVEQRDSLGRLLLFCNQCGMKAQVGFISFCGHCGAKMQNDGGES